MAKKKVGSKRTAKATTAKKPANRIQVEMPDLGLNRKQLNDLKKAIHSTLVSTLEAHEALMTTSKSRPKVKTQTYRPPKFAAFPSES